MHDFLAQSVFGISRSLLGSDDLLLQFFQLFQCVMGSGLDAAEMPADGFEAGARGSLKRFTGAFQGRFGVRFRGWRNGPRFGVESLQNVDLLVDVLGEVQLFEEADAAHAPVIVGNLQGNRTAGVSTASQSYRKRSFCSRMGAPCPGPSKVRQL
jgi:hypothetical protein